MAVNLTLNDFRSVLGNVNDGNVVLNANQTGIEKANYGSKFLNLFRTVRRAPHQSGNGDPFARHIDLPRALPAPRRRPQVGHRPRQAHRHARRHRLQPRPRRPGHETPRRPAPHQRGRPPRRPQHGPARQTTRRVHPRPRRERLQHPAPRGPERWRRPLPCPLRPARLARTPPNRPDPSPCRGRTGLQNIPPVAGVWKFSADGNIFGITADEKGAAVWLYGEIPSPSPDRNDALLKAAMEANHFRRGTGGGTFSLNPDTGVLTLADSRPLATLDEETFYAFIERFINALATWKGLAAAAPPSSPSAPPPPTSAPSWPMSDLTFTRV